MWESIKKFGANNVMALAISVTIFYVWLLMFSHGEIFTSPGIKADDIKLNILGDSVGGLTAPLALIWLIAAVVSQRQELKLTKDELANTATAMAKQVELMHEQSKLQREVAISNLKVTWFQERFALYVFFKGVPDILYDGITFEKLREISNHIEEVRFVFGSNVCEQGKEFFALTRSLEMKISHYEDEYTVFPRFDEEGCIQYGQDEDENAMTSELENKIHEVANEVRNGQFMKAMEAVLELNENVEFNMLQKENSAT